MKKFRRLFFRYSLALLLRDLERKMTDEPDRSLSHAIDAVLLLEDLLDET